MSWQSYVDDQLISTNMIKNAVIAGHDGNIWASSSGFNVTAAELKVILDRYSSTDQLAMNGVTVGGTKYMFLSANDRVVRARKGQSGVHCIKTVQGTSSTSLKVGMSPKVGWNTRKGIACGRILPFFPVHPL